MFIKEVYNKKTKEFAEDNVIKSTYQIGSIKNNKIDFDQDEQFFSNDDIPQEV